MRLLPPLLLAFLAGCATVVGTLQLDERFGKADPARFDHPAAAVSGAPDYWEEVRPLLDQRCVSCHACYDAPCQLNLTSYDGLTRGAIRTRLRQLAPARRPADPARLRRAEQCRLAARRASSRCSTNAAQTPEANRDGSVMYRMLALKQKHPGRTAAPSPTATSTSRSTASSLRERRGLRRLRRASTRDAACPSACRRWRKPSTRPSRAGSKPARPTRRRRRSRPSRWRRSPTGRAS